LARRERRLAIMALRGVDCERAGVAARAGSRIAAISVRPARIE
jgi:hypothetical protein